MTNSENFEPDQNLFLQVESILEEANKFMAAASLHANAKELVTDNSAIAADESDFHRQQGKALIEDALNLISDPGLMIEPGTALARAQLILKGARIANGLELAEHVQGFIELLDFALPAVATVSSWGKSAADFKRSEDEKIWLNASIPALQNKICTSLKTGASDLAKNGYLQISQNHHIRRKPMPIELLLPIKSKLESKGYSVYFYNSTDHLLVRIYCRKCWWPGPLVRAMMNMSESDYGDFDYGSLED